jgi:hypothetical protein
MSITSPVIPQLPTLKDEELAVPDNPRTGLAGYLSRLCPFLTDRIAAPSVIGAAVQS